MAIAQLFSGLHLLVAILCASFVYLCFKKLKNWFELPPGPVGLPLVGRLFQVNPDRFHLDCLKISQRFGSVSSLFLGRRLIVLVSDFELVKELQGMADELSAGRRNSLLNLLPQKPDVAFADRRRSSVNRRASLPISREYGFATTSKVEHLIQDAARRLVKRLKKKTDGGESGDVMELLTSATKDVMTSVAFGLSAQDVREAGVSNVPVIVNDLQTNARITSADFLFPASVKSLCWILGFFSTESSKLVRDQASINTFIFKLLAKRKAIVSEAGAEPDCFCDSLILQQRLARLQGDLNTFSDVQLMRQCAEVFFSGTDATLRSMQWLLLFTAVHANVQEKVHQELDEVIVETEVTQEDHIRLHFTRAVIDEAARISSVAAFSLFHSTQKDIIFYDFKIPANSTVAAFPYTIHRSPKYWKHPERFYPKHFLDEKGHYRKSPYLMPFSVDKNACLGKSVASMEIFMFFVYLLQNFSIQLHEDDLGKEKELLECALLGYNDSTKSYKLVISKR